MNGRSEPGEDLGLCVCVCVRGGEGGGGERGTYIIHPNVLSPPPPSSF